MEISEDIQQKMTELLLNNNKTKLVPESAPLSLAMLCKNKSNMAICEAARLMAIDMLSFSKRKTPEYTKRGMYGFWFRPIDVERFKLWVELMCIK